MSSREQRVPVIGHRFEGFSEHSFLSYPERRIESLSVLCLPQYLAGSFAYSKRLLLVKRLTQDRG